MRVDTPAQRQPRQGSQTPTTADPRDRGGMRMDALLRVFALLWAWFAGAILGSIAFFVGILWMVPDVLWQLVTGREGLDAGGRLASWLQGIVQWGAMQTNYALFGDGEFKLLPSAA
jgi:hypothetical protein